MTRDQKRKAREIARSSWIATNNNMYLARHVAREKAKEEFGSLITAIMVVSAVLQICYTLFKFWKEMNITHPTIEPLESEPV